MCNDRPRNHSRGLLVAVVIRLPPRTIQGRARQDRTLCRDVLGAVALVAGWLVADAALADTARVTIHPGDGACFAYVHVLDRPGTYNRVDTVETIHGPVSVRYITHGGVSLPDEAEVVGTPQNVIADPWGTELIPGEPVPICLRLWEGM